MSEAGDWPSTHKSLLLRLRTSDARADWDLFVEIYAPLIERFCQRRGLQAADAADVAQNVFLAVRRGIRDFEYDSQKGMFRSWLGTVTVHEIRRHRRRSDRATRGAGGVSTVPNTEHDNDAGWIVEFNSHVYDTALKRIRPEFDDQTWEIFEAVWIGDARPRDVAAARNLRPDRVYRAKFKVLQRLKEEIEFLTADIAAFSK
jgi:RNA polymerase sigma-70 factor (ECF subfamily)